MTGEHLLELILLGRPRELAEALAPLDAKERRALADTAWDLYQRLHRHRKLVVPKRLLPQVQQALGNLMPWDDSQAHHNARLAVLGTGTLTRTKGLRRGSGLPLKGGRIDRAGVDEALQKIVLDRHPKWIEKWIAVQLEREDGILSWPSLRAWTRAGLCAKPESPAYTRLFMEHRFNDLEKAILNDPELLEDEIWRLFKLPNAAFKDAGWPDALAALAAKGNLERGRLLGCCVSALGQRAKRGELEGYHLLHDALEPTIEEHVARQELYRRLLGHPVSWVVRLALDVLGRLEKARQLEAGFLEDLAPLMVLETKGLTQRALRLAKLRVRREPGLGPRAARVVVDALAHAAADIQGLALDLLEEWNTLATSEDAEELPAAVAKRLEYLGPALRKRAEALAAAALEPGHRSEHAGGREADDELSDEELNRRVQALDPEVRRRCGLESPLSQLPRPPIDLDPLAVPVLSGRAPVTPVGDLEELLDLVGDAMGGELSADNFERLLDGLSRLCAERPTDFSERTEAFRHRLDGWSRGLLYGPLLAWFDGQVYTQKTPSWRQEGPGPLAFLHARVNSLSRSIAERRAIPLLAAPTHEGGWIDPRILVERARELEECQLEAGSPDAVQALLRLAPDHRPEALRAAGSLTGGLGRILRFALGGEGPKPAERNQAELWLAAGRARSPRGSLRRLLGPLKMIGSEPDGLEPAVWSWCIRESSRKAWGRVIEEKILEPVCTIKEEVEPSAPDQNLAKTWILRVSRFLREDRGEEEGEDQPNSAFPTTALIRQRARKSWWEALARRDIHLLAMTWPLQLDGFFALGVRYLVARSEMDAAVEVPNHAWLDPLFASDQGCTEMARLLLALGLNAKDTDARGVATEVLLEMIGDDRLEPELLVEVLLLLGPWSKLGRLAECLGRVAGESVLHELRVGEILEGVVAGWQEIPRDAHHVLEVLRDVHTAQGKALGQGAKEVLSALRGRSKASRLAMEIMALEPTQKAPRRRRGLRRALTARLARAERWQGAGEGRRIDDIS